MSSEIKPPQDRPIFGIQFSRKDFGTVADALTVVPPPARSGLRLIVTANVDHVVTLMRNPEFRAAYDAAELALVDGTPVLAYARLRGVRAVKVTGADLFPAILKRLRPADHRPAMICSNDATARALDQLLDEQGFAERLVVVAPEAFERNDAFGCELVASLGALRATHVFFGLGAPKSEIWMHRHRAELPDSFGFGFGAALDFAAGTKRRAPMAFQRAGIEFLWRVAFEPRRLTRRYFVNSWGFLRAVARDLAGRPIGE